MERSKNVKIKGPVFNELYSLKNSVTQILYAQDLFILTIYCLPLARKFSMTIYLNLVWKLCQNLRISSWQKLHPETFVCRSTIVCRKNLDIRKRKEIRSLKKNIKTIQMPSSQVSGKKKFMQSPVGIYLLKVNNRNTRTRCEICSKLTTKTPERHHCCIYRT